ncbi:MAG: M14 family metallopeptidase, partial [Planctomycetota bacterium]
WPFGRGNHYLFDMNRDWIAGVAPETRARWRAARRFWPQIFVDGHEMGPLETFLTYPQAEARHPRLPQTLLGWQGRFADDLAAAFDTYGWGYYTREWADGWAPFYSDAWGSLTGAVGILYEQARGAGKPVKRRSGEVVPYRRAVHGQFVASLANLRTLAENRVDVRRDFFEARRAATEDADQERVFVALEDPHRPERLRRLIGILTDQGIEYRRASNVTLASPESGLGHEVGSDGEPRLSLTGDAIVVPLAQPQGRLVDAFLTFDQRMPKEYLDRERADLERQGYGNIYDATAWDLGRALDLDCYWGTLESESTGASRESEPLEPFDGTPVGWVLDGRSDLAPRFAARAMESGIRVAVSDREFVARGRTFARGSLWIAVHENSGNPALGTLLSRAAESVGVEPIPVGTQRSPDLEQPDFGGGHFTLLERPRIAILSNSPVQSDAFGHLWQHLDEELRVPYTMLDAQQLGAYDLRRYNVLILPPGGVGGVLAENAEALATWTRSGGTLIACDTAAVAVADAELGLSSVRRHADVLAELDVYRAEAELDRAAGTTDVDVEALYSGMGSPGGRSLLEAEEAGDTDGLERRDRWTRRFAPSGVILRAEVDERHWLTAGCGPVLPVYYAGADVLRHRGDVPIRLADEDENLRLGGLVWPEARERLALGAWATTERVGNGQVILFAANPVFRGYWHGTARVFANAVIYGPGLGASAPVPR